jgi:hypothetical protein
LYTLGSFSKKKEVAKILWLLFSKEKSHLINFDKHGLGYTLGDFFTNSSGHHDSQFAGSNRVSRMTFEFANKVKK